MAVSEALRLSRLGRECISALELGLSERQLCLMTGLSLSALEECRKVAELYADDNTFLKAFQNHDLPAGSPYRTWSTFLLSLGINTISQREADVIMAGVKSSVHRIAMWHRARLIRRLHTKRLGRCGLGLWEGYRQQSGLQLTGISLPTNDAVFARRMLRNLSSLKLGAYW